MQRVRLSTAHGHILLTAQATHASGLALLREAAQLAAESGLSHQLLAIAAIRHQAAHTGPTRKETTASRSATPPARTPKSSGTTTRWAIPESGAMPGSAWAAMTWASPPSPPT